MEHAIVLGERFPYRWIVEEGETSHGHGIQVANPHGASQIDRRSGGRLSIRVCNVDLCFSSPAFVQGQTSDLVQGAAVAEQHVQVSQGRAEARIGRCGELALEFIPGRGFPSLARAGQRGR